MPAAAPGLTPWLPPPAIPFDDIEEVVVVEVVEVGAGDDVCDWKSVDWYLIWTLRALIAPASGSWVPVATGVVPEKVTTEGNCVGPNVDWHPKVDSQG